MREQHIITVYQATDSEMEMVRAYYSDAIIHDHRSVPWRDIFEPLVWVAGMYLGAWIIPNDWAAVAWLVAGWLGFWHRWDLVRTPKRSGA